jgi:hypothetical protein
MPGRPPRVWLAAMLCALPAVLAAGQLGAIITRAPEQNPGPTTGLILGRVVDANDGKPIASAFVTISGPIRIEPPGNTVVTDPEGRFVFGSLPAGSFSIAATADGYQPGDAVFAMMRARRVTLGAGQKLTDLSIALARDAVITGTVTDDGGDPLVGASVAAIPRPGSDTSVSLQGTVGTDDRGVYRIDRLRAGEYLIVVRSMTTTMPAAAVADYETIQAGSAAMWDVANELARSNAPTPSPGGLRHGDVYVQGARPALAPYETDAGLFVHPTTYFDGATTPGAATVVRVAAGDERQAVDIRVPTVRAFSVSGQVTVPEGPAGNLGVILLPAESAYHQSTLDPWTHDEDVAKTVTTADGHFTLAGVPPGTYKLRVLRPSGIGGASRPPNLAPLSEEAVARLNNRPTLYALAPVAISDRDVTGIVLATRAGPRVSGHVEFVGAPPPDLSAGPRRNDDFNGIRLDVPAGTGIPPGIRPAPVGADGRFTTMSMPPGRYFLGANLPVQGWTLGSALVDGRDVSRFPLDLAEADITDVAITFVPPGTRGTFAGVVRDARSAPDANAAVYCFPADYQALIDAGSGALSRATTWALTDARGTYRLSLPTGSYLFAAVHVEGQDRGDVEKLAVLLANRATRVTSTARTNQVLDLGELPVPLR